jgi:hypothetical protein
MFSASAYPSNVNPGIKSDGRLALSSEATEPAYLAGGRAVQRRPLDGLGPPSQGRAEKARGERYRIGRDTWAPAVLATLARGRRESGRAAARAGSGGYADGTTSKPRHACARGAPSDGSQFILAASPHSWAVFRAGWAARLSRTSAAWASVSAEGSIVVPASVAGISRAYTSSATAARFA